MHLQTRQGRSTCQYQIQARRWCLSKDLQSYLPFVHGGQAVSAHQAFFLARHILFSDAFDFLISCCRIIVDKGVVFERFAFCLYFVKAWTTTKKDRFLHLSSFCVFPIRILHLYFQPRSNPKSILEYSCFGKADIFARTSFHRRLTASFSGWIDRGFDKSYYRQNSGQRYTDREMRRMHSAYARALLQQ